MPRWQPRLIKTQPSGAFEIAKKKLREKHKSCPSFEARLVASKSTSTNGVASAEKSIRQLDEFIKGTRRNRLRVTIGVGVCDNFLTPVQ